MYAQVEKTKEDKSRTVANYVGQKKDYVKLGGEFMDNRPIQLLKNLTEFKTDSKLSPFQPRKKVLIVDVALANFEKLKLNVENNDKDQIEKGKTEIQKLIAACDTYLGFSDKEANRKPSVKRLRNEAVEERNKIVEKLYYIMIAEGKFTESVGMISTVYGFGGDYDLSVDKYSRRSSKHAKTKGGYHSSRQETQKAKKLIFNEAYLKKIADDKDFSSVVHTFMHERTHIEQRAKKDMMEKSTKNFREFDAYSNEVLNGGEKDLPPLKFERKMYKAKKAIKLFNKMEKDGDDYFNSLNDQQQDIYRERIDRLKSLVYSL